MLKQLVDLMIEGFNEFAILSEHDNGYCYEIFNVSVPFDREELVSQTKRILVDFNMRHKRIAQTYLDKDKAVYSRMVEVQLQSCENETHKEFYSKLFTNIHKAKSPINKLIVTPIELLHVEEGAKFS